MLGRGRMVTMSVELPEIVLASVEPRPEIRLFPLLSAIIGGSVAFVLVGVLMMILAAGV